MESPWGLHLGSVFIRQSTNVRRRMHIIDFFSKFDPLKSWITLIIISNLRIWDLSLERDEEEEAEFKAKTKEQVNAPQDLPPQLLFVHQVTFLIILPLSLRFLREEYRIKSTLQHVTWWNNRVSFTYHCRARRTWKKSIGIRRFRVCSYPLLQMDSTS